MKSSEFVKKGPLCIDTHAPAPTQFTNINLFNIGQLGLGGGEKCTCLNKNLLKSASFHDTILLSFVCWMNQNPESEVNIGFPKYSHVLKTYSTDSLI